MNIWVSPSLEGLHNVTTILGDLHIYSNSVLTSLNGLRGVKTVGGNLNIYNNANLVSVEGLQGVTTVEHLHIANNVNLTSLEGLCNLKIIRNVGGHGTSLYMVGNSKLARGLPFPKLRVNNGNIFLGADVTYGYKYGDEYKVCDTHDDDYEYSHHRYCNDYGDEYDEPNAYVASHRKALERVPRA